MEGLTEYFTRKIVYRNLDINTNMAYPVNIKIINQMAKRIPESDLADIYFNNDQQKLKRTIDLVYGDNFYDQNVITLETLQYSSDPDQILLLANDIMEKIGGEPLDKADLKTTYSIFE
jgi:hypothetical protein